MRPAQRWLEVGDSRDRLNRLTEGNSADALGIQNKRSVKILWAAGPRNVTAESGSLVRVRGWVAFQTLDADTDAHLACLELLTPYFWIRLGVVFCACPLG